MNERKDGEAMTTRSSLEQNSAGERRASRPNLWWGRSAAARDAWVLRGALWLAIAAELLALVMPFGLVVRVAIGATALIPLMWIPPQIERAYLAEAERTEGRRVRRFLRLRSLTDIVLAIRLKTLISEIRDAAGVETQGLEPLHPNLLPKTDDMITLELGATVN
jgi:hypothetical protein